jgi:hypothetical protein
MSEPQLADIHFVQGVEKRLQLLRKICVLESVSEGRARLAAERPVVQEPFDLAVERRLRELRALMELTRQLHNLVRP